MEETLPKIMLDNSECEYYKKTLSGIKTLILEGKTDEAIEKIDKLYDFVDDNIEYMKAYAEEYPLDGIRKFANECIEKKTVPYMNDDGVFEAKYEDIVKLPLESVLYDLNRDFGTIYAKYSPNTLNDIGCSILIKHLMEENKDLKAKLK